MPGDVRHGSDLLFSPFGSFIREADAYHRLGMALERAGIANGSAHAYHAAAELDCRVPEIANSLGGAFNGQEGRRQLFLRILEQLRPAAIVETGTFRGCTTRWIAERFDGPILSCEIEPRYYLFARKALAGCPHVKVSNEDSRVFLRRVLPELDDVRPVLFYLDAHWKEDLPLEDETREIMNSRVNYIIMIDDFEVPSDPGYGFDDYVGGKRLSLSLLSWAKELDCRFFFPTLAAADETGKRRGACLIAGRAAEALAALPGLREASSSDWQSASPQPEPEVAGSERDALHKHSDESDPTEELLAQLNLEQKMIDANWRDKDAAIARLNWELAAAEADRGAKDVVIARLGGALDTVESDRRAKDAVIARLSGELEAIEADRRAKDAVIARLSGELEAIEADRRAKDAVIARVAGELEAIEADRRAKDVVIARLAGGLEAIEADRRAKDEVIARLAGELRAVEAERAAKNQTIAGLNQRLRSVRAGGHAVFFGYSSASVLDALRGQEDQD